MCVCMIVNVFLTFPVGFWRGVVTCHVISVVVVILLDLSVSFMLSIRIVRVSFMYSIRIVRFFIGLLSS